MKGSKFVTCFLVPLVLASAVALAEPGDSFNGAVYTSTAGGTTVNTNTYAAKEDVYLNGGPQNKQAAGLPDGTYYFQVTDPSGATLLSTDPAVCRQVVVNAGIVAGVPTDGPACLHAAALTPDPNNNSVPVQLMPFADTPNGGGEYKVWLIREGRVQGESKDIDFENSDAKTDNFKILPQTPPTQSTFTLSGTKFYDANADTLFETAEPGVAGVRIDVELTCGDDPVDLRSAITEADGQWSSIYAGTNACTYKVREQLPSTTTPGAYWVQTSPVADSQGFQGYSGTLAQDVSDLNFGNVCLVPASGGKTLGYWSNKNGQKTLAANAPAFEFIKTLPLVKADGTLASFTDISALRSWLLDGNAVNMAYMLSVQLAATELDVHTGFLNDGTIIDARSFGRGFPTIDAVMAEAIDLLKEGTYTPKGSDLRDEQEKVKNILDAINNNNVPFASGTPCTVFYPTVDTTATPTL